MLCPDHMMPMHQRDKLAGGESTDDCYSTYMILECPVCGRLVKESYECRVIGIEDINKMKAETHGRD